jgi:cytoplasmic iron level regulating protein YaaA (DUF328/UPF0246 family)
LIKFLFSPSEAKVDGGSGSFDLKGLLFSQNCKREEIVALYDEFITHASDSELSQLFGLKEIDDKLRVPLEKRAVLKAIERYSGVAYEHLNYMGLNSTQQNYIDDRVIIFSNLFGHLRASDMIPIYKLKQGEKLDGVALEKVYKKEFSKELDELLEEADIVDLRAVFYKKFYDVKSKSLSMKFIKNNKVVSHYAKAYRGLVLKECAVNNIKSSDELISMPLEGLKVKEIVERKKESEVVYEII